MNKETLRPRENATEWAKSTKTYTFRRERFLVGDGEIDFASLANNLVEDCLSKGYIPTEVKCQVVKANASYKGFPVYDESRPFDAKDYKVVRCWCAYAGKKAARVYYAKNGAVKFPTTYKFLTPKEDRDIMK